MSRILFKLLFIILVCTGYISIGQTNVNNNVKLNEFYNNNKYLYSLLFDDLDNKENDWFSLITDTSFNLYLIDNDLNVKKTLINNREHFLYFKLNNKLYGTQNYHALHNSYGLVLDSMYLYVNDTNSNNLVSKIIFNKEENDIKLHKVESCFLTHDYNIAILSSSLDTSNNNAVYYDLMIIDTLGNKKKTKSLLQIPTDKNSKIRIYETDFVFRITHSKDILGKLKNTTEYYLDKNSLHVIDSAEYDTTFFITNHRQINDSIYVTISSNGSISPNELPRYFVNIVNYKTMKLQNLIKVEHGGVFVAGGNVLPLYQKVVDFINPDSIYYCCIIRKADGIADEDLSGYFQIINFDLDGNLNLDYRFDYDTLLPKYITGVKATEDGGVLMSVQFQYSLSWIVKFMPNGFVGLTNIETNEKASIKVYPNPARDFINVDIEADRFSSSEIELFDNQGIMVQKSKLNAQIGNRIDVSTLNPGAYTYRVVINGKGISGKVIIGE